MTRPRVPHAIAVPALLALFALCGFWSLTRDSATFDETPHIGAGLSYLERGDFRLNPEHPPLAKAWAALPLKIFGLASANYGTTAWTGTSRSRPGVSTSADQWVFGFETINGPLDSPGRRDPARALVPARVMILLLGIGLGLLVYSWSRALWGPEGALLSLVLFALSPTMLAHARLVTTDIAATAGFLGAAYAFRRAVARPSLARIAASGLALGGAFLTKFSTLLLVPALAVAAAIWVAAGEGADDRRGAPRRAVVALRALAAAGVVAWVVVWAGYGFRFAASADPSYELPWSVRAAGPGGIPPAIERARAWHLMPEAFLFGLASAMQDETRLAYLNGEISETGWRLYFPEAFALKTPPALMLLALLAAWLVLRRARARPADLAFLAAPACVYALFTMGSRLNIGHRHLAPLEPLLYVACGAIAAWAGSRARAWAVGALVAGYAASFAFATPGYLAYFNIFAGGTRGGARFLLDSNLDWGQDLPSLKRWLERAGAGEIALAYFGTADPKAHGLRYRKIVLVPDYHPRDPAVRPAPGELVAVSANLLHGLYLEKERGIFEELDRRRLVPTARLVEYTSLREALIARRESYPPFSRWVVAQGLATPAQVADAGAGLLATWMEDLRARGTLVGRAGSSILIYRAP